VKGWSILKSRDRGGTISDPALRQLILSHIGDGCHCASSDYGDVHVKMARHFTDPSHVDAVAGRIKPMLRALKGEGLIETTTAGNGEVCSARLRAIVVPADDGPPARVRQSADPESRGGAVDDEPDNGDDDGDDDEDDEDDDGAPEEVAMAISLAELPPRVAAFRKLILLWLLVHRNRVEESSGAAPTLFRAFYGLDPSESTRRHFAQTVSAMEAAGEITRHRTRSGNAEDEMQHSSSKKNYRMILDRHVGDAEAIDLLEDLPDLLTQAEGDLELARKHLREQTGASAPARPDPAPVRSAAPAASASPTEALGVASLGDQPGDDTPDEGDDAQAGQPGGTTVVLDTNALLELAERVGLLLPMGYEALTAAAEEPGTQHDGPLVLLSGRDILGEVYPGEDITELRWYLQATGSYPVKSGPGGLWWWRLADNAPTKELITQMIVHEGRIYGAGTPAALVPAAVAPVAPAVVARVPVAVIDPPPAPAPVSTQPDPEEGIEVVLNGLIDRVDELEAQLLAEQKEAAKVPGLRREIDRLSALVATQQAELDDLRSRPRVEQDVLARARERLNRRPS
jgi:hypothetical protein